MLCSPLHPPAIFRLLGPNILLSTLLSGTLILCSSLSVRDKASHPYKTKGKTISFKFLENWGKDQRFRCTLPNNLVRTVRIARKRSEKNFAWRASRYYCGISLEHLRKATKLLRIIGLPAETCNSGLFLLCWTQI
jgi:hypothetical protein